MSHFLSALTFDPDNSIVHFQLGCALMHLERFDDAMVSFRRILELEPDHHRAQERMGSALQSLGAHDEAIRHYRRALELEPDYVKAHVNLGNIYDSLGKRTEAIDHYHRALRVEPGDALTHYRIGLTMIVTGRVEEGISHIREVTDLAPEWADPLNNAAWILATDPEKRRPAEAVTFAERAAAITRHRSAPVLDTLAAAYASAGQFDQAVKTARLAIELAREGGNPELVDGIAERLGLYRKSESFTEKSLSGSRKIIR